MRLSPEEQEIAKAAGITETQYAQSKLQDAPRARQRATRMKDDDTEFTEDELRSMARVERRCGEYQIGAGGRHLPWRTGQSVRRCSRTGNLGEGLGGPASFSNAAFSDEPPCQIVLRAFPVGLATQSTGSYLRGS